VRAGGASDCCTPVIWQRVRGRLHVRGALCDEPSGARQHLQLTVLPWLREHVPWVLASSAAALELVHVRYDPACDTDDPGDRESNPLRTMKALLPGQYRPGPVTWAGRRDPLLATLNALRAGEALLQIDPACRGLIRALRGGWHYATKLVGGATSDTPMKPNHPDEDYGDSLASPLNGVAPLSEARPARLPYHAKTAFNPLSYGRPRVWPLGT